jgi:hypothetical protein
METHSGGSTATCGSRLCERAMKARQLIDDASYGPEAVKALGQAFDEAWVNIAGNFGDDPSDIEERVSGSPLRCCRWRAKIAAMSKC